MADTTISGPDNIIAVCNKNTTADAGKLFKVQKQTGPTEIFRVDESGHVTLYGDVFRSSQIEFWNDNSGTGTMVSAQKDSTEQLFVKYDSSAGSTILSGGTGTMLTVRSANDIIFQLDQDNNSTATFYIKDIADDPIFTLTEAGALTYSISGTDRLTLTDGVLDIGLGGDLRGGLRILPNSALLNKRAGLLILEDKNGTPHYFWVDNSNRLRTDTADPGTSAGAGVVVGA